MKESDWKQFKVIKEKAIERFCTFVLEEFEEVIANREEHPHNRYLLLYKLVENRDKEMSLIFDGHSRSRAAIQLTVIRAKGLVEESLLDGLSEDFLTQTDPVRLGWGRGSPKR
jgi:hypothetical protein